MSRPRRMFLGAAMPPTGGKVAHHHVPPHHLVTHGVVLGMTGSGKTGLLMVTVEEALRSQVPVIMACSKERVWACRVWFRRCGGFWLTWARCCHAPAAPHFVPAESTQ
jgi:hypothetical protein